MRGALLMCVLVLLAALSMHYSRVSEQARLPESNRSDPIIVMQKNYDDDQPDVPTPGAISTASAADTAD